LSYVDHSPVAIRVPEFFEQMNALWPPYLLRDTMLIAEQLGMGVVRINGRQFTEPSLSDVRCCP
jgi:hypothetical protein